MDRALELDKVSLVRFRGDLHQTISLGLSLIGFQRPPDETILIKPNLCSETDVTGASANNVTFIKALIDLILEKRKATIRIIEADSTGKDIEAAFKNLGYIQLTEELQKQGFDVSLINLSKEPLTSIPHKGGLYFREVKLPTILTKPKFLISVAKAKTHSLTTITGALKNQFGCLPEKFKSRYHRHIDEVIVDVNRILKPDLCIVDAIVGQEGVAEGKIREVGVVICGRSPASVDSVMAQVMRIDPKAIKHLTLAEEQGLGSLNPIVIGNSVDSVAIRFDRPGSLTMTMSKYVPNRLMPLASKAYRLFK